MNNATLKLRAKAIVAVRNRKKKEAEAKTAQEASQEALEGRLTRRIEANLTYPLANDGKDGRNAPTLSEIVSEVIPLLPQSTHTTNEQKVDFGELEDFVRGLLPEEDKELRPAVEQITNTIDVSDEKLESFVKQEEFKKALRRIQDAITSSQSGGSQAVSSGGGDGTDWELADQGTIHNSNYVDNDTTYVSSDFTHDSLTGVSADEHIDWSVSNVKDIHPDNYTSGSGGIDWTLASQGTIHATNYVDTDTIYDDTAIQAAVALNTAKVTDLVHPLVETAVPSGALFTDTIYTLPFADNSANWDTAYGWGDHSLVGYSQVASEVPFTPVGNIVATDVQAALAELDSDLPLSTVDFDPVGTDNSDDNAVNTLYSGLVTNATHTGDVTGDTALTIVAGAVDIAMLSATGTASASTYLRGDNTWATPAGGGATKDYAHFYLSGAGNTGLTNTEVTLTLNATGEVSNSLAALATNIVTVNKTGIFKVDVNVYLNNSSTSRTEYSMWLEQEGVEVAGTRFASYQRGYDSGMSSGMTTILNVTTGDELTIRCIRTDGSATAGYQDANGTSITIVEL